MNPDPRHELPLKGQVALVTGGSRGIGLAIARRLGQMGARIAVGGRDASRLEKCAGALGREGIETLAVAGDVMRAGDARALVEKTREAFGDVDILVNNAGVGVFRAAHELSEEDWDRVMDTNLKGVFLMSRAVAPHMIRRRTGHIINISSLAGKNAFAGGGVYCASKWGLQGLTASMAEDLRGYGIRVSSVCPGSVNTEFAPHTGKDPAKLLQPEDVAHAVAMLATQAPQSFISEIQMRPAQKP
jgi:NAD(P)-dependent dehydrogenase (short-subunit alcohol dehydrogenase family)